MRTCSKCGDPKPLDREHFYPAKEAKGGFRPECRVCTNKAHRSWQQDKAEREGTLRPKLDVAKAQATARRLRAGLRKRNLEHVLRIKASGRCADCGHSFPPICMDFDHTEDNKERSVAELVARCASIARIDREIAKCELVCSNCHRLRTARRGTWYAATYSAELAELACSAEV